ncbi:MAG: YraN family protein [Woeseiaceae bacterium]|nr:YraN family protein [Woeseiaceae bacterium]
MEYRRTGLVGQRAEQFAFGYLQKHGLRPIARNFHRRGGEIDLIMLDGECLTFIEVRYRASTAFGSASQTVDFHKQRKIISTAALFVAQSRRYATHTMRFDIVAIEGSEELNVEWIKDAFRPNNSTL